MSVFDTAWSVLKDEGSATKPCPCGGTLVQGKYDRWVWDCNSCGASYQMDGELGE